MLPIPRRYSVALLIFALALSRFLFRSHFLYDLDSVDFGLALRRFDPSVYQPHPPGYFLYVCLGRLLTRLWPDPNTALVALSIAASCGAAWFIYLLAQRWYGPRAALISLILFLLSPLGWFHGIVALTYIVEAFFSALLGYLCWRVYRGEARLAVIASVVYAVAAGFRPSAGLLLGPLWLFSLWRIRGRQRIFAVAAAALAGLAWFLPMIAASGGFQNYFEPLLDLWLRVPGQRTMLEAPALAVARMVTILWIFCLCFGFAVPFLLLRRGEKTHHAEDRTFIWAWIGPGLLFFSLVFLNYVNSGYLLVVSPPLFALVAVRIESFLARSGRPVLRRAALWAGALGNCAVFLAAPLYCTHRGVADFERDLISIRNDFLQHADPRTTLIVGFDSHFLGYRHAGYYLPDFVTVQYPEVTYPGGKRVFLMRGGDTQLVAQFSAARFTRFVFFPLPPGAEYTAYVREVAAKLPQGAVERLHFGSQTVLAAPISALSQLFPTTARDCR